MIRIPRLDQQFEAFNDSRQFRNHYKSSNMGWEDLKDRMRGSMVVRNPR